MDSYAEQIVKKADGGSDNLKRTACLVGGVLAAIVLVILFASVHYTLIGSVLGVGAFYAGLYLGTNFDIEYEYLIVNGDFDIDKILAKRRRKKFISLKLSSIENIGKYSNDMTEGDDVTLIWAVGNGADSGDTFFADFNHSTYGKCRLLFSPSVRVLREIKNGVKGSLRNNIGELPPEEEY